MLINLILHVAIMNNELKLEFYGELFQLSKTHFKRDNGKSFTAIRGKTAGAIQGAGTFQWSSAVRALSVLMVRSTIAQFYPHNQNLTVLSGFAGSLAATLDYALSKQPTWTTDIFGVDSSANSYMRKLLLRTNPERKYPGPVSISLNSRLLSAQNIKIFLNDRMVVSENELRSLLANLEAITATQNPNLKNMNYENTIENEQLQAA